MKVKNRRFFLIVVMLLVVSVFNGHTRAADFDENSIVLRFGVLSDLHAASGTPKFEEAVRQLYEKAGEEKLDAIVVAGDLTDNGAVEEIQSLKGVLDRQRLAERGTEFVFTLGNHDILYDKDPYNGIRFKQILKDYAFKGATEEEIKNGNHHIEIEGYHFLALNCKKYNGGAEYAPEDLEWLRSKLEKVSEMDPRKPIFLVTHPVVYNTTYGSVDGTYWHTKNLHSVIKDYPQVIVFSGHLHFPLNSERSIFQGDYTTINTAATYYCSLEGEIDGIRPIDTGGGMEPRDRQDFSQGLYLEVDENGNTRITRMDFFNKDIIKEPWIIPAPRPDKSHLLPYADTTREAENTAPYFPEGAAAKILGISKTSLEIEFDTALDDDLVYYYEIHLLDKATGKPAGKNYAITYSDFYRTPKPENMKRKASLSLDGGAFRILFNEFDLSKEYVVKIVAVDSFGLKSEPIYSDF